MVKKDISISVNKIMWENARNKIQKDFGRSFADTDTLLIIMMLSLYKPKSDLHSPDNLYLAVDHPSFLKSDNYISKTVSVYDIILTEMKKQHPSLSYNDLTNFALGDYLVIPNCFYTDCISPLYTIVGSKNFTMQKETASAVDAMHLNHSKMDLIDGCCATGSLFFGIKTYPWKNIILNDLNPLRTNFLNVLKNQPLKLIKMLLETDFTFINTPDCKNPRLKELKLDTNAYEQKRHAYHKVDCNVKIASEMFLQQCIDKAMIEQADHIFIRILRFLPAHLKLRNATITQIDCLTYLNSNSFKLVLLDVPYIGSEKECAITSYHYDLFHKKVTDLLKNADFPFLYYCRSSAPKSDKSKSTADKEKIMKMKLGMYFMGNGFYFKKVYLKEDTELMISNQHYLDIQFQWDNLDTDIL